MKGRLKFPDKDKGVMLINGDPSPEVAVNIMSVDLAKMKVESSARAGRQKIEVMDQQEMEESQQWKKGVCRFAI